MTRPDPGVIHLDTSFVIRSLVRGSRESDTLRAWLVERRPLAMSTIAWAEFLCGPLAERDEARVRRLTHTLVPFGPEEAAEAARLFNHAGRRRGSFADCLVAATALAASASLATADRRDFERFLGAGLRLAEV